MDYADSTYEQRVKHQRAVKWARMGQSEMHPSPAARAVASMVFDGALTFIAQVLTGCVSHDSSSSSTWPSCSAWLCLSLDTASDSGLADPS